MRLDAAVGRRAAVLLAATALTAPRITPAAEVTSLDGLTQGLGSLRQPYCVPGVTAKRCRGTFWETGQLYKKDESVQLLSPEEYSSALASLDRLGGSLREVRKLASTPGGAEAAGDAVGGRDGLRAELRQLGGRICKALSEDLELREDAEYLLKDLIRELDDVDSAALRDDRDDMPSAFSPVLIELDGALKALTAFRKVLPEAPPV